MTRAKESRAPGRANTGLGGMRQRPVAEAMTPEVSTVFAGDDLASVGDLMVDRGICHLLVVDEEQNLVGLVSLEDLRRAGGAEEGSPLDPGDRSRLAGHTVSEIMVAPETVVPETSLTEAAGLLLQSPLGCLPVVEGTHVVGMLTESDFIRIIQGTVTDPRRR